MYRILIPKSVQKELDNIDDKYYSRIINRILEMEINPRPAGCLKLSDSDEYRIRVGQFRILYEIYDKENLVKIYKIEHRKDVYRRK